LIETRETRARRTAGHNRLGDARRQIADEHPRLAPVGRPTVMPHQRALHDGARRAFHLERRAIEAEPRRQLTVEEYVDHAKRVALASLLQQLQKKKKATCTTLLAATQQSHTQRTFGLATN
jgi:hypothetical protein